MVIDFSSNYWSNDWKGNKIYGRKKNVIWEEDRYYEINRNF